MNQGDWIAFASEITPLFTFTIFIWILGLIMHQYISGFRKWSEYTNPSPKQKGKKTHQNMPKQLFNQMWADKQFF